MSFRWVWPERNHRNIVFHTYSIIQAKFSRVFIYNIVPYSALDLKVGQSVGKSQIYDPFIRYICSWAEVPVAQGHKLAQISSKSLKCSWTGACCTIYMPQGITGTQETIMCQQVTVKFCLRCILQEQCYGSTEHSDTSSPPTTTSTFQGYLDQHP